MALLDSPALEGGRFKKKMNEAAMPMLFKNVQSEQYKYPIKSFIRETVSNCVDAIREKDNAVAILTGKKKVTDIYAKSSGEDLYEDSKFNPEYYTLVNLGDPANDKVEILYVNRPFGNRDLIRISDTGVGIGGERLENFFDLGFSTKRLNKYALGKFGIGSKSALAPGAESYRMITVYNRKRFIFDIFNDDYDSIVPKFTETGMNKPYIFDGEEIYYEETTAKNGTVIELEIKNPTKNKREYINAVKDQLTYFDYVTLHEVTQMGENSLISELPRTQVHFRTKILYEDDRVIIPESSVYSKPHLLLNGVNYGVIDFPELELNDINVCIGIKGDSSKIAVTPSRESIIYNQKTGDAMKDYITEVGDIARRIVAEAVAKEKSDFVSSLKMLRTKMQNSAVVETMAKFAGLSDLQTFKYKGKSYTKGQVSHAESCINIYHFNNEGNRTTKGTMNSTDFSYDYLNNNDVAIVYTSGESRLNKLRVLYLQAQGYSRVFEVRAGILTTEGQIAISAMLHGLQNLSNKITLDEINVPSDFRAQHAAKLAAEEEAENVRKMSAAERRKLLGTVLTYSPYFRRRDGETVLTEYRNTDRSVSDIADSNYIVGTKEQLEELLPVILDEISLGSEITWVGDRRVMYLAKPALNKVLQVSGRNCVSILDVLRGTLSKNKITMIDDLKRNILVEVRKNMLAYWKFLPMFEGVDKGAYDAFILLKDYGIMSDHAMQDDIAKYFMKMVSIQTDIEANPTKKDDITAVLGAQYDVIDVVDMDMYSMLEALSVCVSSVGALLSMTAYGKTEYNTEEVYAIKEYLEKMEYVPYKEQLVLTTKKYKHD